MNPAKQVSKTPQDIAKNIAKQIAQEPVEILKTAGDQLTRIESSKSGAQTPEKPQEATTNTVSLEQQQKDKAFSVRRMQALQSEINDIRKQEIFKDLQEKISQGQEVLLEDFPELSMEQKQVLKAQAEAVKFQRQQSEYQASVQEVPTVHSKPSRRFGSGQKHEAEKQQTRVEKPVPPSG